MKGFLIFLLILLSAGLVIYFVPSFRAKAEALLTYNACNIPLAYRLGSIDTRFGLTNNQVLDDLQQAGNIWSNAEGKPLFVYSPQAVLTVNFIYDQRQALDSSINQLHDSLTQKNQTLTQQIEQYKADYAAFKAKLDTLNATISKYNQEGGAPQPIYNDLIKQQQELDAQGQALNERAMQLNLSTDTYNNNVATLNNDINTFDQVLTQKPEEGLYNGEDTTITIYFADNKEELLHTLTHELGHALGMVHVKDPTAIMYPYTTPHLVVTADDAKQLSYVCRDQSLVIHDLQEFDLWLVSEIKNLQKQIAK